MKLDPVRSILLYSGTGFGSTGFRSTGFSSTGFQPVVPELVMLVPACSRQVLYLVCHSRPFCHSRPCFRRGKLQRESIISLLPAPLEIKGF